MQQPNSKLLVIAIITLIAGVFFTACQQLGQNPSGKLNTGTDRRHPDRTTPPKEIFPTLKISRKNPTDNNIPPASSEFQLRVQTSAYTNASKSAMEVILTDSRLGSCEKKSPELAADESIIKLTVKSKNGKALTSGDYTSDKYDIALSMTTKTADQDKVVKFDSKQIESLKVTDLNDSIFRGNFKAVDSDTTIEGEFFTAICR